MQGSAGKLSKTILLAVIPLLALLFTGEAACRIKYYFSHNRDLSYLLAPFLWPDKKADIPRMIAAGCRRDSVIYSPCAGRELVWSHNEYCWRGRSFQAVKPSGIYRILAVGGSTVESVDNADEDTWVYRLGKLLDSAPGLKDRVEMINAGRAGFKSDDILEMLLEKGFALSPDMLVYYEAFNDARMTYWSHLDNRIAQLGNSVFGRLHRALHYRSMLYTYLVEKTNYLAMAIDSKRIKQEMVSRSFREIIRECEARGNEFVYVCQVIDYPLERDGLDLWRNPDAIWSEIKVRYEKRYENTRESRDKTQEFWALRQRMRNAMQAGYCREHGLTVIDPLPVYEVERKKADTLFTDLVHLNCYGDRILADCVFQGLLDVVGRGVRGRR